MEISLLNIFQFVIIGLAVGFLGGFLGLGGGAIMKPLFIFWVFPSMGVSPKIIIHLCFGTSLAIIIPNSIAGSWAYNKSGIIDWRVVFLLALPGVMASFLGSTLAALLEGLLLRVLFGIILIIMSGQMLFQKSGEEDIRGDTDSRPGVLATSIVGILTGLFAGFFGMGGGVLAVPLMLRFLKIPIHRAVAISLALILFTSLVGTAGYVINGWNNPDLPPYALGYVHILGAALAGIPSIFMIHWGVQVAKKTKPSRLRQVYALLMAVIGIRMII